MLNEGILVSDTTTSLKSEMLHKLAVLKQTTPDQWERAVFESVTGHKREDVNWEIPDNQAGYYTWIRTFDRLISELEEDGYVKTVDLGEGRKVLQMTDWEPQIACSELVYRSHPSM